MKLEDDDLDTVFVSFNDPYEYQTSDSELIITFLDGEINSVKWTSKTPMTFEEPIKNESDYDKEYANYIYELRRNGCGFRKNKKR
jgi:hypothetical protein